MPGADFLSPMVHASQSGFAWWQPLRRVLPWRRRPIIAFLAAFWIFGILPGTQGVAGAEPQSFRFWEDSTGEFRILARMTGYENSEIILQKEDGTELRVLRSRLSEEDVKHVDTVLSKHPELRLDQPPPVEGDGRRSARDATRAVTQAVRLWEDTSGEFSIRARMVDYEAGKVVLEKEDGGQISVPKTSLSEVDRRYVDAILERRRDLLRDEKDTGEILGEGIGGTAKAAVDLFLTILLAVGMLVTLWGLFVFFRAAFEEAEYWLLGLLFPPLALGFAYLHWELARPGLIWLMSGLGTVVVALLLLGDDWARNLPSF